MPATGGTKVMKVGWAKNPTELKEEEPGAQLHDTVYVSVPGQDTPVGAQSLATACD
ncbi:hypothetical protein [Microbulbifer sp. 2205BS26-8]|uniref:hypothetical protein n=1 Tax=Microbulbifer sp. 2205BS26-8 TaxID=3064386 RepID=UPI00273DF7C5|nr:hypothetical protein [Microbulbifer sp. 2205BS26-8]MDP5210876.1 hypothetical protein [Microbulbifer sp. 2205BS26-8]